jgi:PAS domain S-box-containing protein
LQSITLKGKQMARARVLIVEDERVVALDLRHRLSSLGYTVAGSVSSSSEALAAVQATQAELVLMDIRIKGEPDGIETARQIRSLYNIPVIYVTAYADDVTVQRAKLTEPFGYLVKPYDDHALRLAIEMALSKHRAETAERQRVQETLEESEERYRALVENTQDIIFTLLPDGAISSLNPAFETLTGWPARRWIGRSFAPLIRPDQLAPALEQYQALLKGETPPVFETYLRCRNDNYAVLEVFATPLVKNGQISSIVGSARDITERKRMQEDQLRRRRALHLMISSMPNLLLIINSRDCLSAFYAPPEMARIFDLSDELIGMPFTETLPPALAEAIVTALEPVRQSGRRWEGELSLVHKDETYHLKVTVSAVVDSSDVLVIVDDITQLKQAEQALRESEERYRLVTEEMPIGIGILQDMQLVYTNRFLREMWWEDEEPSLERLLQYVPPDQAQQLMARTSGLLAGEDAQGPFEITVRDTAGQQRSLVFQGSVIQYGGKQAILGTAQDITERRLMEKAEIEQRNLAEALRDTSAALSSTLDLAEVLDRILDNLDRVVPHDAASIMLLEDGIARVARHRGYDLRGQAENMAALELPVAEYATLRTMADTKRPLVIPDVTQYTGWANISDTAWVCSHAAAPILVEGSLAGFICVDSATPDFFSPEQASRLEAFTYQVGAAIRNARLYDEISRHEHYLETLRRVSWRAVPVRSRGALAQAVTAGLVEEFAYAYACVFLLDQTGQSLVMIGEASLGPMPPNIGVRLPITQGIVGRAIRDNLPVLLPDVAQAEDYLPIAGLPARSELAVPIRQQGRPIGVLNIEATKLNAFDELDQEVLLELAEQLALSLENVTLYEQARETAAEAERQRLARDLHDAVSQTLFSASVIAEMLPRIWQRNPGSVPGRLAQLHRLIRGAIAEMRTLLLELRPTALTETDLSILLSHLVDAMAGRTSMDISFEAKGEGPLPPDVQVGLYRIAQEALNNVLKHSHATAATVQYRKQTRRAELRVKDNGRGFEAGTASPDRLGLSIMQERAGEIGAIITVNSGEGRGTEVAVVWPSADAQGDANG